MEFLWKHFFLNLEIIICSTTCSNLFTAIKNNGKGTTRAVPFPIFFPIWAKDFWTKYFWNLVLLGQRHFVQIYFIVIRFSRKIKVCFAQTSLAWPNSHFCCKSGTRVIVLNVKGTFFCFLEITQFSFDFTTLLLFFLQDRFSKI